jgi:hypothetical protein
MPRLRFVLLLVPLGLLAACSPDYSAIRAWSMQARDLVQPPLAQAGATPSPGAPASIGNDRRDAVAALQDTTAAWLATLATLADDGRLRERENPLTGPAGRVEGFDGAGATAILEIGEVIADGARRNWRAPDLATAVARGDAPFQALLAALGRQLDMLALETPDPRADLAARYAALLADRPTRSTRAALDELRAMREQDLLRRARSAAAWRSALVRIGEGHALLNERQRHISQAETARLVRAQESALRQLALLIESR